MSEEKGEELFRLVKDNHLWLLATMIELGADANTRNKNGLSLLTLASQLGRTKMANYLKSKGAIEINII